jgi:hypothetical protein
MVSLKIGNSSPKQVVHGRVDINGPVVALYSIDKSKKDEARLELAHHMKPGDRVIHDGEGNYSVDF